MLDVQLLVVDLVVLGGGGGEVPLGGEFLGEFLAGLEGLGGGVVLEAGPALEELLGEGFVAGDAGLHEELVLGVVEGVVSESVEGLEEHLLVLLDEDDVDGFGGAWRDDALVGTDEVAARLRGLDFEGDVVVVAAGVSECHRAAGGAVGVFVIVAGEQELEGGFGRNLE